VQLGFVHRLLLKRGWGERDAPEVGGADAHVVLNQLEGAGRIELVAEAGEVGDRAVPIAIPLEQLQRLGACLRAAAPAWPIDGEGGDLLVLRAVLDDHAGRHAATVAGLPDTPWQESSGQLTDELRRRHRSRMTPP
jgi:hypothetical protein